MAGTKIRGITIELNADASGIQKALKGLDSTLKTTQSNLKDINKLLKLDPGNTELLTQKQKNLETAISTTKDRIEELRKAQEGVAEGSQEWDALQREIIANEQTLKQLEEEYRKFGSVSAQQIKAVGSQMQDLGGKIEGAGKKLSSISTAAGGALTALVGIGVKSITAADDLNTLARQTGFTTTEIQRMQYASDLVDVSFEDISSSLKKFKGKIDPANESLKALNVATVNEDGSLRDVNDVFFDAITALGQVGNETQRDQMAMELFGKSADSLAGIIDDGGAALKEYGDEAEAMGLILSQDTLDSLNETNDTLDRVKANLTGTLAELGATIGQTLAPVIEKASLLIGKVTEKLRDLTPQQAETIMKILAVVAAVAPALIIIGKVVSGIGSVISVIGTVVGVLGGPLTIAIAAAVAAGVLLWKNWDTIKAKVGAAADWIKGKFEALKEKIRGIAEAIKSFFQFKISIPKIKLPHLKLTYTPATSSVAKFFGVQNIPHLSVQWYKKAYDNPMMFTSPTVMATPSGMKGFGDGNGAEIVMSLKKLQQLVGASQDIVINVYGAQGQDVNALADAIQNRLVALQRQKEAAAGA